MTFSLFKETIKKHTVIYGHIRSFKESISKILKKQSLKVRFRRVNFFKITLVQNVKVFPVLNYTGGEMEA
jgi:hypothetical protein